MELHAHVLVLAVLAAYTALVVLLVARNVRALRTHHACTDVATPLCKTVAGLLDASKDPTPVLRALAAADFYAVRILVYDQAGSVLLDTREGAASPHPPTESQRDARAAYDASAPTHLVHRPSGTAMAHVAGATSAGGALVLTETLAV